MARPTIVVVDDEVAIIALICTVLYGAGMLPIACQDAREAIASIQATHPSAIVLDVQMTRRSGIKVFEELRANPATKDIPVVFCTVNKERLLRELPNYQDLGAVCITKPFENAALVTAVKEQAAA